MKFILLKSFKESNISVKIRIFNIQQNNEHTHQFESIKYFQRENENHLNYLDEQNIQFNKSEDYFCKSVNLFGNYVPN